MAFQKRTEFVDEVDEEIYNFSVIVKIAEHLYGSAMHFYREEIPNVGFIWTARSSGTDTNILFFMKSIGSKVYEILEVSSSQVLMNVRLKKHIAITHLHNEYRYKYSFFDKDECELDHLLDGGIMRITEEEYFQYSLVCDDYMAHYEDLPRFMEMLKIETSLDHVSLYHEKCKHLTAKEYNEIYDVVLTKLYEFEK
jgi:hypothetical protein